ncbi:hypothetical protein GPECTOR_77g14 [Gonium pectorale]|uniref:Restriction endonuclease domain-containing protein n=1 Tax=Gonium pectorale TaxID=33097 RepID=A0A150G235_GONPE|nr:hypothetical protein GPECTOR_77g14 [Gonium pectorale]|eukprot:KXZ43917.1 hypothetical protein GPECTOR_77g14 [Gonium pectorale]
MVKLPCPGRTEVARMVTGALRQALQREQLGRLVKSQKRTPMHFSLGAGVIRVYYGNDKDLFWVRCPDAALVPCGRSWPSLVVEVGMPGESQTDLQERCRRWFCEPCVYNLNGEDQPISVVISLHIRPWQGSDEQHLVIASLLTRGVKAVQEEASVTFGTSSAVDSGCQGGSGIISGEAVWQLPVRSLLGSLAEGLDEEREQGDENCEEGKQGHLSSATIELDVPAALAGIGKALRQRG